MAKTRKLYCYVDETGQDTLGAFFIVAVVVTDNQQHQLEASLEAIERAVGKRTKWMKTRDKVRAAYAEALAAQKLPAMVFVKRYTDKKDFDDLEVLATAQAIHTFREVHSIREDAYKLTITVDGLSRTAAARMASEFRKLGIKPRKIVGKKDGSSAIIRLADAMAGLTREAYEGRREYEQLETKLRRTRTLREL